MSGDKLTLLIFLVGSAVAAVIGAISVSGMRSRILWGIAVAFGVAAVIFLRAAAGSPGVVLVQTAWGLMPLIAALVAVLITGGRKPLERPTRLGLAIQPTLNPALTTKYLNDAVKGSTKLEAQRKLATHANQLARIKGQVENVEDAWGVVTVRVKGIGTNQYDQAVPMEFKRNEADALEVIKPGDWIEFTGKVKHCGIYGWTLVGCEFVGRADAPQAPKTPRQTSRPRKPREP